MGTGHQFLRVDYLLASTAAQPSTSTESHPGSAQHQQPREIAAASRGGDEAWQLLLGEMTPYPGGGGFHWDPPEFDQRLAHEFLAPCAARELSKSSAASPFDAVAAEKSYKHAPTVGNTSNLD